ncbi:glycosyltransferase [Acidithiobacillus sp. CV18-2]|nr:glycosyltransferase [Acidithiobacillus sp. CV18-3]MBU2757186.1 glycosyltransferase [Acidithiobacillus sp. BN09-2]MBU2776984.1 glycosyltransferase [Acidithiobacillus sp. CV18-2]MBU2800216.1 glycosyltransferase [Acidithiobacillus sp. VAN18-4]
MPRSIGVSTVFNFSGRALPAVLLLVTTPIYLHLIGVERYGAMSILWLALGYFGVFDLGLGRAVAQRIAQLPSLKGFSPKDMAQTRGDIFWTSLVASIVVSSIASVGLFWPLMELVINHVLHISQELRMEADHSIWVLLLFLPIATTLSVLMGTLEGTEHFGYLNAGQLSGLVAYQLFPLGMALLGHVTLPYLMSAAILGRMIGSLLLFAFCQKALGSPRPRFHWKLLTSLLRYGGWITISAIVGPIMNITDRFFIGVKLGMSYVAHYVVPFNMVMYGGILPQSLATALFPRYAALSEGEAQTTMLMAVRLIAAVMVPLSILGIWWMHGFLTWWLGSAFAAPSAIVGELLLVGLWINAIAHAPYGYLQARGRADLTAKFHLIELAVYLPTLWWAISTWGIAGAAFTWDLRVFMDLGLLLMAIGYVKAVASTIMRSLLLVGLSFWVATLPMATLHHHSLLADPWFNAIEGLLLVIALIATWRYSNRWAQHFWTRRRDRHRPTVAPITREGSDPMVAIVMAVYNGAAFLEEQVDSILNQTYRHFHLYIRDDGSSDGSPAILERLSREHSNQITLIQDGQQRRGVVGNFQILLDTVHRQGRESYVMLADQDDVWFSDKVARTLQGMRETERWAGKDTPVLIHTDLCVADAHLHVTDPSFWYYQHLDPTKDDLRSLCMQNMVTGCTAMMNRALLAKALPIPANVLMHDWWLGLVSAAFGVIRFLPKATMFYRQHGRNDTGAKKFGVGYLFGALRRVRSSSEFWRLMQRMQQQVALFLERFQSDLNPGMAADLRRFAHMAPETSTRERLYIVFIRHFSRHGWVRNLGLAMRLAIG